MMRTAVYMICISIANDLIITMIVDIYLMGMVCFSDCWFVAWWSDSFRMLALRKDICQYAIVESAAIIPDKLTAGLVAPLFSMSFPLIKKKWFAKMQFCYLGIRTDLFEHYYGDTVKLSKQNLIAFIKASSLYQVKKNLKNSLARVRIIVGEKETKKMHASARYLHDLLPDSRLEIKAGLAHGQYAINQTDLYVKELFESL